MTNWRSFPTAVKYNALWVTNELSISISISIIVVIIIIIVIIIYYYYYYYYYCKISQSTERCCTPYLVMLSTLQSISDIDAVIRCPTGATHKNFLCERFGWKYYNLQHKWRTNVNESVIRPLFPMVKKKLFFRSVALNSRTECHLRTHLHSWHLQGPRQIPSDVFTGLLYSTHLHSYAIHAEEGYSIFNRNVHTKSF